MQNVCLIHGLIGGLDAPEILKPFEGYFSVTAPHLLGYGVHAGQEFAALSLQDQAQNVIRHLSAIGPAHLVGHSVGGVVSVLVAAARPDLVLSLISVEGNFTLKDAFWSSEIARQDLTEVERTLAKFRADPFAWIDEAISEPDDFAKRIAPKLLDFQPASTLLAQARAIINATQDTSYLEILQALMKSAMPVHLIAGERSALGWDCPEWANRLCTSRINIPGAGHLMMIEKPVKFAAVVMHCIELSSTIGLESGLQ